MLLFDGALASASQSIAKADGNSQGELCKVMGALKRMEDRQFSFENSPFPEILNACLLKALDHKT